MINKNLKIALLTSATIIGASSVANAATNSQRIRLLEDRLAKMEKSSAKTQKLSNFLDSHKIFGRLQFDKTFVTNDNGMGLSDNSILRRGRIGVKGKLDQGWDYKFEVDFAKNKTGIKDAYIGKKLTANSKIKIGNFKEPFSLEGLTSSRFTTFVERASINGFVPGRKMGISYALHGSNANFYAGVFGDEVDSVSGDDDESVTGAARATYFLKDSDDNAFHLGLAYRYSQPNGDSVSYGFKPEATIETSGASKAISSSISNANAVGQVGAELAIVKGPLSLQGEYIRTEIDRDAGFKNQGFNGHYVEASYFLTDDKRNYNGKKGAFGRVSPSSKSGAWQIAYRYSETDMNDDVIMDGSMENHTYGINYYATKNVRFLTNYVVVNVDENSFYGEDAEIFAIRAQIDF
jgi:phosphate-selective porin OprO/OprP